MSETYTIPPGWTITRWDEWTGEPREAQTRADPASGFHFQARRRGDKSLSFEAELRSLGSNYFDGLQSTTLVRVVTTNSLAGAIEKLRGAVVALSVAFPDEPWPANTPNPKETP